MRRIFLALGISAALPVTAPTSAWRTAGEGKNAQVKTVAPDIAEFDKQLAQVQEKMQQMQAAWIKSRIHAESAAESARSDQA